MPSRRRMLKLMGSSSIAATGIIGTATPAAAMDNSRGVGEKLGQSNARFATVDATAEAVPDNIVPIGGSSQTSFLEDRNGIYLQGDRSAYELPNQDDVLLMVNQDLFVPVHNDETTTLMENKQRITNGAESFIGSYDQTVRASADGPHITLQIGSDTVVQANPNQTQSVEREMEISYTNERGEDDSTVAKVTFTVNNMGQRQIFSHPSKRIVPKHHRLGTQAERAMKVQEGMETAGRQTVPHGSGKEIKTANGVARVAPLSDAEGYVIEKEIGTVGNGGGQ